MDRLSLFTKYRNFEFVNSNELDLIIDYICGNLNSTFCNYRYWYDMYSYTTKSRIVISHRTEHKKTGIAKLGECVCENQVINFLENENNLCNCNKACASVYFKVVF